MTSFSSGSGERPLVTDSSAQKVVKKWGWLHIKYLKKKDKIRRLKTQLKKKTDLLVDLIQAAQSALMCEVSSESEEMELGESKMLE